MYNKLAGSSTANYCRLGRNSANSNTSSPNIKPSTPPSASRPATAPSLNNSSPNYKHTPPSAPNSNPNSTSTNSLLKLNNVTFVTLKKKTPEPYSNYNIQKDLSMYKKKKIIGKSQHLRAR